MSEAGRRCSGEKSAALHDVHSLAGPFCFSNDCRRGRRGQIRVRRKRAPPTNRKLGPNAIGPEQHGPVKPSDTFFHDGKPLRTLLDPPIAATSRMTGFDFEPEGSIAANANTERRRRSRCGLLPRNPAEHRCKRPDLPVRTAAAVFFCAAWSGKPFAGAESRKGPTVRSGIFIIRAGLVAIKR
jgi:hypothetical protein